MAYTGTATQVWIRVCETAPIPPGPAADCAWVQFYRSVLDVPAFDVAQLDLMIGAGILLFVMVFIIGMAKKAIEQ